MKKIVLVFLMLAVFSFSTFAQEVKGRIVDEDGVELIGASVIVKDGKAMTITDFDGTFTLEVPANKDIEVVVSFVGFVEQTFKMNLKSSQTKDIGEVKLAINAIGIEELKVIASFAVDRRTPVSVSKISPEIIAEKLGTQEFPEILKSTPSVYATKTGGGYGDGRINLRGFDSNNIGVLINGVPVNDMESGKVYWSNWAGLSDVTRSMQVQRGLGASKLAISSVGGTINILTKSTDMKKGGSVYYGMGNNGYNKMAFTVSTGLLDNNWAVTVSGAKTTGDGYVKGTDFEGYSYFLNISKRIGSKQTLSFTAFGASQWHHQRSTKHLIETFRNSPFGTKLNTDYGYRDGKVYGSGYAYNAYTKPQTSLNHYWHISPKTTLSTSIYASFGRGGGRRLYGPGKAPYGISGGKYENMSTLEALQTNNDGYIDFDQAISENIESTTGSQTIIAMSNNSHDWYGILSSLNTNVGNVSITGGIDARYYKGYHNYSIVDLLGGNYFLDDGNENRDPGAALQVGDEINYYNLGEVLWEGLFLQGEYVSNKFSGFLSTSASMKNYRRTDFFQYTPEEGQVSDWVNFLGYSGKGGANLNITDQQNIFINGGYFSRAPYMRYAFIGYTNDVNEGIENEKVLSAEFGYGFKTSKIKADLTLYHTRWMDKALTKTLGDGTANILGLDAIHQGVEFEFKYKPSKKLEFRAMASMGDWKWGDDVIADVYNEQNELEGTVTVYTSGVHVGDAAQTTAALGIDWEILKDLKVGLDFNHYDRLYAQFEVDQRTSEDDMGIDSWLMPDYQIMDFNVRYRFKMGKFKSTLYGKIDNIFDTEYISDGFDGSMHNSFTSGVYYGFGRTWSIGIKTKF